jgi:hypothetical protein
MPSYEYILIKNKMDKPFLKSMFRIRVWQERSGKKKLF